MCKLLFVILLAVLPVHLTGEPLFRSEHAPERQAKSRSLKILAIGDSNGALKEGWVYQLQKLRSNDTIFNISISGNTIGFNNLGRSSLNTLSSIGSYMDRAYTRLGSIDIIIIMLGTNDCKAVFKDSLSFVPENIRKLTGGIRNQAKLHKDKPIIYIVSPPPFGPDNMLDEKYKGGLDRITWLNEELSKNEGEGNVRFINSFRILLPVFRNLTIDGVHLNPDGQRMIALIIEENLKYFIMK